MNVSHKRRNEEVGKDITGPLVPLPRSLELASM